MLLFQWVKVSASDRCRRLCYPVLTGPSRINDVIPASRGRLLILPSEPPVLAYISKPVAVSGPFCGSGGPWNPQHASTWVRGRRGPRSGHVRSPPAAAPRAQLTGEFANTAAHAARLPTGLSGARARGLQHRPATDASELNQKFALHAMPTEAHARHTGGAAPDERSPSCDHAGGLMAAGNGVAVNV